MSEQLRKWKMIIAENLVRNRDHPVIFVYYEQLKSTLLQLAKVSIHDCSSYIIIYRASKSLSCIVSTLISRYSRCWNSYNSHTLKRK